MMLLKAVFISGVSINMKKKKTLKLSLSYHAACEHSGIFKSDRNAAGKKLPFCYNCHEKNLNCFSVGC